MQKNVNKFTKEKINQNTNVRAKTQFCQRIVGNYSSPIHRPHPLLRNLSPASKWIIKKTKIGSFDTMGGAEGKKGGVAGWLGGGRGFKGTTRTRGSGFSASYLKKKFIFLSIFLFISESIQQRAARYGSSIKYFFLSFSSTQCVNFDTFFLFFFVCRFTTLKRKSTENYVPADGSIKICWELDHFRFRHICFDLPSKNWWETR